MSDFSHFLDELRSRLTLSEIIGRKIPITKAGREFKACCPFHHEKSPSFTINDQKGFYHCFGCGAHGDAFKFKTDYENYTFKEALDEFCAQTGMTAPTPPRQSPKERDKQQEQSSQTDFYYEIMEKLCSWFEQELFTKTDSAQEAQNYLKKRGISLENVKKFRLGFAPPQGSQSYKFLKGCGYEDKDLVALGLIKTSEKTGKFYGFFRNRIIFPVLNKKNKVVAFGARVLRTEDTPKYLNSPETPIFHKGHLLYGINFASKMTSQDNQNLYICEGYLDVIALQSAGYKGAMAPLGTALTEEQIALLWQMNKHHEAAPILCFDGDNAGLRAALRAIDKALPHLTSKQTLDFIFLPQGYDPDSLLKEKGAEALRENLEKKFHLIDVLWDYMRSNHNLETPEGKVELKEKIVHHIKDISDSTIQNFYKKELTDRFYKLIQSQRQSLNRTNPSSVQQEIHRKPINLNEQRRIKESLLLAIPLYFVDLFADVVEPLSLIHFEDEYNESLRHEILEDLSHYPMLDPKNKEQFIENKRNKYLEQVMRIPQDEDKLHFYAPYLKRSDQQDQALQNWEMIYSSLQQKKNRLLF